MGKPELLRMLEKMLGAEPHTLTGGEQLRYLGVWDSLCTLKFIAMVDKEFGLPLPGSRVARCQTVDELLGLIGNTPLAA